MDGPYPPHIAPYRQFDPPSPPLNWRRCLWMAPMYLIKSVQIVLFSSKSATLQSCTGPVQGQNRVFPVKFSTQGKTCFHYREPLFSLQGPLFSLQGFSCEKTSQGIPCFHLHREWVCSTDYGRLERK